MLHSPHIIRHPSSHIYQTRGCHYIYSERACVCVWGGMQFDLTFINKYWQFFGNKQQAPENKSRERDTRNALCRVNSQNELIRMCANIWMLSWLWYEADGAIGGLTFLLGSWACGRAWMTVGRWVCEGGPTIEKLMTLISWTLEGSGHTPLANAISVPQPVC